MKKLGLALGGGGARGLAHIGVLKVLEAEGIPVGCIAGTSMGGIVAALYASGKSPGELEAIAQRLSHLREMMKLVDFNPPRRGLLEGKRVREYLTRLLGGTMQFADLNIPLALISVNLIDGCKVVLKEGPLLPAVLATCAFPGLLPPQELNGMALVDGGVLDNVPAEEVRQIGAEVVISVDVINNPCEEPPWPYPPERRGRFNPLPDLFSEVYRSELIMVAALTQLRLRMEKPDLLLRPSIPAEVDMFLGFPHADAIIHSGETACRDALPRICELLKE